MQELKDATILRNIYLAVGLIDDTDRFVNKRINDFKSLVQHSEIQDAVAASNDEFKKLPNIEEFLQTRDLEFTKQDYKTDPFISGIDTTLSCRHCQLPCNIYFMLGA